MKSLKTIDGETLMSQPLQPLSFAVDTLISQGLHKPVQESTVQKYLTVVSTVLSDAKRNKIIEKNPARMIDLPDTARRVQMIPSDAEAHRFLDVLANEEDPYKTFCALAIYSCCRRGELCALK